MEEVDLNMSLIFNFLNIWEIKKNRKEGNKKMFFYVEERLYFKFCRRI